MNPNALLQRALAAHREGKLDAAARDYAQVRRLAPRSFDVWHLSGTLELQRNNLPLAIDWLSRARTLNPRDATCSRRLADAHDRAGTAALAQRQPDAAVPCYRAATRVQPDWPQPWCNLGLALIQLGQFADAEAALDRAIGLDPVLAKAHSARGLLLQQSYRLAEAAAAFGSAIAINPQDLEARSGRLLTLHYLDDITPAQLAAEHRAFGEQLAPLENRFAPTAHSPAGSRKLRVAFVSQDFRRHSVAWFMIPLLEHLDRTAFELHLYHDHAIEDDVSQRLRGLVDHWENLHRVPDATVITRLRAARIDLAIDLAGHTGVNRLGVFAQRIAPVQVSYLGYPDTTGLHTMDYRFVDPCTDPIDSDADTRATETLVRFSDTLWTYAPPPGTPEVSAPPSRDGRPPTFGSFNAFTKASDATIALWSRLLERVPGSRLLLKSADLDQLPIANRVRRRFATHGIQAERLCLLGRTPDAAAHLDLYREIDVALDPLPYHGTTTTCEALWMGRPVVTLAGNHHANRVGVSLLNAVKHPEWIAHTHDDYLRIAADLVADPDRLATQSAALRRDLQRSLLMDHHTQATRFSAALRSLAQRHELPAAA